MAPERKRYRALTGIDYGRGKRVEAGEVVTDLPAAAVPWLLECGAIEEVTGDAEASD